MSEQRKMYADLKDELLITRDQIAVRVKEMGAEITRDFEGKDLTVICILKGAVVFFVDLIREIDFYTGAFPADRAGALSSVLDFRLRDGDPDRQRFRATLGASEVGLSGSGHIGEKATFLFSARQSYLQMLFKLLGLPFLPNYIDAQAKVRIRFSQRDELTVLALAGIDNMRLNTDEKGEETEYLLSYLPRLRQETFTVGASYRHYAGRHAQTVTLSHSYLNNRNTKYLGNDESSEDNLTLRLRAVAQKT